MNVSMQALKSAGVEGIMMDVWWGLVEREGPGFIIGVGIRSFWIWLNDMDLRFKMLCRFTRVEAIIPLPKWVVEEIDKDQDLAFTDQWGRRNYEYLSLGCDTLPVLKGRTPVQCYGHYNNWPEDTQFFRKENGGWTSPYGEFFLGWYSQMLLDHGERILSSATSVFENTGVKILVKVAGIHWHYGTRSHAP